MLKKLLKINSLHHTGEISAGRNKITYVSISLNVTSVSALIEYISS